MLNKRNRDTLIMKYGLNNPFLVGSKRKKYCVFVYNPETKRLNTVYFDKFDNMNKKNQSKIKEKSMKQKKIKTKLNSKNIKNKKAWATEYFAGWNKDKKNKLTKMQIKKGKFKKK